MALPTDTSAIANMNGGINPQTGLPIVTSGTQPQKNVPGVSGGIDQMVRALMTGNDQYNQAHPQAMGQPALAPGSAVPGAVGPTAVGGPSGPSPLPMPDPAAMQGGFGAPVPMPQPRPDMAFPQSAPPVGMDPATAALMSPIPGVDNNGGY